MDRAFGWRQVIPIGVCEKCLAAGGPTERSSRSVREAYFYKVLKVLRKLGPSVVHPTTWGLIQTRHAENGTSGYNA